MTSLYRKWRSRSFADLVGQEHVVRTLRNAVRSGRVAHAYLFTGPRGTGKTSTARILARAVNCLNPQDGNPCNECEACVAVREGRALDVIEIDAASNTSVENVRDLRERVAYAAGEGRYKVYIVDEVHRLSGAAFDAFLKTIEEPPPHVIFVFASTEPHKVPATIASRCQRFDFRRIPPDETRARLAEVAGEEAMAVAPDALDLIAHSANGSLRDALSLLDQVASFAPGEIRAADVRRSLGLADPTLVARLTDAMLGGDAGAGLAAGEEFFAAGGDPGQLMAQLIAYWRAILLTVTTRGRAGAGVDPGLAGALQRHAGQIDERGALAVLQALTGTQFSAKYDVVASLPFEVALVEAALALRGPPPRSLREVAVRETPPPALGSTSVHVPPTSAPAPPPVAPRPASETRVADAAGSPPDGNGQLAPGEASDLESVWTRVVERMRAHSPSLQALLRGGHLLGIDNGEARVGFQYDFHRDQVADPRNRRVLEAVVGEVLGGAYRVECLKASKEELKAVLGANVIPEDDGFIEEAAERLRRHEARKMNPDNS